jgi:hypothetical protein
MQADYFAAYRHLKLSRDDKGVLVAEFHNNRVPEILDGSRLFRTLKVAKTRARSKLRQEFSRRHEIACLESFRKAAQDRV